MKRELISALLVCAMITGDSQAMDSQKSKIKMPGFRFLAQKGLVAGSFAGMWTAYNWISGKDTMPREEAEKKISEKAIKDMRAIQNCRSMGRTPYSITGGPYKDFIGEIACIEGDTYKVMGIRDVQMSPRSFEFPAVSNYLRTNPPLSGKVYYGKLNSLGYCFHESWLREVQK